MKTFLTLAFGSLILVGCAGSASTVPQSAAVAVLKPTAGNTASGNVSFTVQDGELIVRADVTGLKPGLHGFHVHEKGDCSAPDAISAGGHFNPTGKTHGGVAGEKRHIGDLGNLSADLDGRAHYEGELEGASLGTGVNSIVGKALVIHADADDMKSQPSGNSGARVACGVVSLR